MRTNEIHQEQQTAVVARNVAAAKTTASRNNIDNDNGRLLDEIRARLRVDMRKQLHLPESESRQQERRTAVVARNVAAAKTTASSTSNKNNNNNSNDSARLLAEIRARGFAKSPLGGRVPEGALGSAPAVVQRSYAELERWRVVRAGVLRAVSQASRSSSSSSSSSTNNVAARLFALKPSETRLSTAVVVGVADAARRLTLRSIRLGEFKLQPTAAPTKVTHKVVVGVRDAVKKLVLRNIRLGEFKLKHVAEPRVRTQCVVGVKEAATRLALRSIRLGEFKLNHVAEPRVRTRCVVGVRDAAMRLSMRSIRLGEFTLKRVAAPRVTHTVVVGLASKLNTTTTTTMPSTIASSSNSTTTQTITMTRDAKALLLRVAEQLLTVDNQATRALIVDLIRLAQ